MWYGLTVVNSWDWMTPGEVCTYLDIHYNTLKRWRSKGLIEYATMPSGRTRYDRKHIQQIKAEMMTSGTP